MMLDVHPLHPSRPFPNRKPNRENRIKNACFSNSHSNIAASNDKRPLFVQIPATSSASLVSTSLPVQCLRPTNFFFFRRIFLNSFLCDQNFITRHQSLFTCHQSFIARHQSLITCHQSFITRHQSFITYKQRKAGARAETTVHRHEMISCEAQSLSDGPLRQRVDELRVCAEAFAPSSEHLDESLQPRHRFVATVSRN